MNQYQFWAIYRPLWHYILFLMVAVAITLILYLAAPQLPIFDMKDSLPLFSFRVPFFALWTIAFFYNLISFGMSLRKIKITLTDDNYISILAGRKEICNVHIDKLIKVEGNDIDRSIVKNGRLKLFFDDRTIAFLIFSNNKLSRSQSPEVHFLRKLTEQHSFVKSKNNAIKALFHSLCTYTNPRSAGL